MIKRLMFAAFSILVSLGVSPAVQGGLLVTGELPNFDGAIFRYDSTGAFQGVFNAGGPTPAEFSSMVRGPNGNVYVLSGNVNVFEYDGLTGAYVRTFVDGGAAGISDAKNIAFGPDGNLYIATGDNGTVDRFNGTTGAFVDHFLLAGAGGLGTQRLGEVMSLAFGTDGLLYVGNDARGLNGGLDAYNVLRFNATTGAFVDAFLADNANGLVDPNALVFGPDGNLYISNEGISNPTNSNILRYNPATGTFLGAFVGNNSGGLAEPIGFGFGPDGFLYSTSSDTAEVLRYNGATGAFVDTFVTAGLGGIGDPAAILFIRDVPEPSTWLLILVGIMTICVVRFPTGRRASSV